MPRKNYGKVRRYRSSFYRSRAYWLRRGAVALVTLAVLFGLGWFIGPAVINFGTHTWYSLKNGGEKGPTGPASSIAASQPQATPTPAPTPTPEPVKIDTDAGWSYVTLSSLAGEEQARATAAALKDQGVRYAVITLKDRQGYIYYPSAQPLAAGSIASTTLDAAAAVQVLKEEGITPVANLYMYQDPLAAYTDTSRTAAIHYEDTDYFWLDAAAENGGRPWLNPYSDLAFDYLNGLLEEVKAMGFEQILLSAVQFPNGASARCGYGDTAGVEMPAQLAAIVARWQGWAKEEEMLLWFEYTLQQAAANPETGSPQLGGGTLAGLGLENVMITLPDDPEIDPAPLLEQARANTAGVEYRVVRSGNTASFDE